MNVQLVGKVERSAVAASQLKFYTRRGVRFARDPVSGQLYKLTPVLVGVPSLKPVARRRRNV